MTKLKSQLRWCHRWELRTVGIKCGGLKVGRVGSTKPNKLALPKRLNGYHTVLLVADDAGHIVVRHLIVHPGCSVHHIAELIGAVNVQIQG